MKFIAPFVLGLVFGIGLCVSGMNDPAKVLGFLDLAGRWDPSLAFVMGGAVTMAFVGFRVARGRTCSLAGEPLRFPRGTAIDAKLIGGAAIFGIGWGLVGLCPGPAITDLGFVDWRAALFVAAMSVGMLGFSVVSGSVRQPTLQQIAQDG